MIKSKCLNKVKRMIDNVKTLYYYIHINDICRLFVLVAIS
nr:MAG TPA: hypothetical protein [Caudoviricetes sp.]